MTVVLYRLLKVDRLTRSLADFAKLVELFDAQNVSVVSVTQSFNTTSSMGRLLALSLFCTLIGAVVFQPVLMGKPRRVRAADRAKLRASQRHDNLRGIEE